MYQNQTSVRKVMTIRISRDLPLGNFERLDILCTWIEQPSETIWISRELPFFNFEHFNILCSRIGISCEKLWPFEISRELPLFNFEHLDILCPRFGHLCEKQWLFEFLESFRCSISIVPIYYVPESDIRAKIHDHLNFSRASIVQFRASR